MNQNQRKLKWKQMKDRTLECLFTYLAVTNKPSSSISSRNIAFSYSERAAIAAICRNFNADQSTLAPGPLDPELKRANRRSGEIFLTLIFFLKSWWVSDVRNVKKLGDHRLRFRENMPGSTPNLRKSGFVSEEDHSGYKSQNIAIRALKWSVLCQIWFKWA